MDLLRVLELYSGIGGMHYALKGSSFGFSFVDSLCLAAKCLSPLAESSVSAEVVAAVDVNTTANEIYKHNFPNTPLLPKTIEGMTLQDFDKLNFDMILMSPPCQPFTRIGLQGDVTDPRTKSFLYILDLLPRLSKRPQFVLLENVKGFETSAARDALLNTLRQCDYSFQEFLFSPTHLRIPNSRLRYFLIARRPLGCFSFQTSAEIMEGFPRPVSSESSDNPAVPNNHPTLSDSESKSSGPIIFKLETAQELERKRNQDSQKTVRRLQEFLREEDDMDQYLLPPKTLLRYALLMDIVQPSSRRSVCFTKGYGHYVEGTGSVLQSCVDVDLESVFKSLELLSDEDKLMQLLRLKLRYFTPREIANLMGFPEDFGKTRPVATLHMEPCMRACDILRSSSLGCDEIKGIVHPKILSSFFRLFQTCKNVFVLLNTKEDIWKNTKDIFTGLEQPKAFPEHISVKQQYRVLGNSLNIHVVSNLIQLMMS